MSHSVPTLFDKYGGVPAVRRLVRQFHERFAASPALRRYFENVDTEKFIKHHAELIAYTLGRPTESFDPHKMAQQHHPHDISSSSFEQVINILRQILLDANFEGRDIAQIIHRLDQQRHRIVRDVQPLNDIYQPEHVDALTGLGNQGALMSALSEEYVQYQKEQRPVSLAIIRPAPYGREALPTDHAGIQLLDRHLTGALSRTARRADTLCRRSDGLFALVLRATDAGKAMQAARRIHAAVTRELFATATGKQRIDLAIGLASCSDAVSSADLLLLAAERAIGSAGQAGQMIVVA
jgi:hemoglobin